MRIGLNWFEELEGVNTDPVLKNLSTQINIVLIRSRYINDGPPPAGKNNNIQRSAADFAVFDVSLLLHGTVDQ